MPQREMDHQIFSPGVREIPSAGRIRFLQASEPMPIEVHPHCFELLHLSSGRKQIDVEGVVYSMSGGEVLLIFPGERHGSTRFIQNRASLRYLLFENPLETEGFCGLDGSERHALFQALHQLSERHFILDEEARRCFDVLMTPAQGELKNALLRSTLVLLLLHLIHARPAHAQDAPEDMTQVARYLKEHPEEMPAVSELAAMVGLSEPRFKQKFKRAMGVPPAEYMVREKIEESKRMLLESQETITRIAMGLGFSSSQHFSVLFKKYQGITPHAFRKGNFVK